MGVRGDFKVLDLGYSRHVVSLDGFAVRSLPLSVFLEKKLVNLNAFETRIILID